MADFARMKMRDLVDTMTAALNAAAAHPHPDAVHDMRVSIRRFQQGSRVFRQFLPEKRLKRIRSQVKEVMEHAGELRNHDIALMLVRRHGANFPVLAERRAAAREELLEVLARIAGQDLPERWRAELKIGERAA
jgi:CHAD domain-containing protein